MGREVGQDLRHWLKLDWGPDLLSASLPRVLAYSPYHYHHPYPSGASNWCFSPGPWGEQVSGLSRAGNMIPGPVSPPGQDRHALLPATFYLDGGACSGAMSKSHSGGG